MSVSGHCCGYGEHQAPHDSAPTFTIVGADRLKTLPGVYDREAFCERAALFQKTLDAECYFFELFTVGIECGPSPLGLVYIEHDRLAFIHHEIDPAVIEVKHQSHTTTDAFRHL